VIHALLMHTETPKTFTMSGKRSHVKDGNSTRSAFRAPILAMLRLLPQAHAQEIGEFLASLNDVSSDFGPGEILRGLAQRTPLPHGHHREQQPAV